MTTPESAGRRHEQVTASQHTGERPGLLLTTSRDRPQALSLLPRDAAGSPGSAAVVVAGLSVAGRYLPTGGGPEPIAGDFYDLLQVGPDRLVLVLGDVAGHGPPALARMQALRTATRAVALEPVRPHQALAALDAFGDEQPDEGLATMWYAEYTPSTGRLAYASAGHPPPVLTGDGQPTRLLDLTQTPPLGTGLAHTLAVEHTVDLPPGATLVVYSDGLVERRDADLDTQLAVLREVVHTHSNPTLARVPQQIADAILAALMPDPAAAQDDVTVMVIQRQPSTG